MVLQQGAIDCFAQFRPTFSGRANARSTDDPGAAATPSIAPGNYMHQKLAGSGHRATASTFACSQLLQCDLGVGHADAGNATGRQPSRTRTPLDAGHTDPAQIIDGCDLPSAPHGRVALTPQ